MHAQGGTGGIASDTQEELLGEAANRLTEESKGKHWALLTHTWSCTHTHTHTCLNIKNAKVNLAHTSGLTVATCQT